MAEKEKISLLQRILNFFGFLQNDNKNHKKLAITLLFIFVALIMGGGGFGIGYLLFYKGEVKATKLVIVGNEENIATPNVIGSATYTCADNLGHSVSDIK
jgi:cell division septal protein FtsQ